MDLECPFCQYPLETSGFTLEQKPVILCQNYFRCGAEWHGDGTLRHESNYPQGD